MLAKSLPFRAVLMGTALAATIAKSPSNLRITLCKSEMSNDCYAEPVQDGICHKVKDPKTYGDKGSFFRIKAPDNWQCELLENDDCTNPDNGHHSFDGIAVYHDPGNWNWDKDWVYASYKCWKS